MSAAFATIDHIILFKRHFIWLILTGTALFWIQSYISLTAISPLKHREPHPNQVWCSSSRCSLVPLAVHPLHYSTQFTHQRILG